MSPTASASPWQPLTFGGVAAFAAGTLQRAVFVQSIVAVVVSIASTWFVLTTCFPVVDEAVRRLPEQGGVQRGRLVWSGPSPQVLGESAVVALAVNAREPRSPGTTADLEVLLTPEGVRFTSLLGHWTVPYLRGWGVDLTRKRLESWWDAWRWAVAVVMPALTAALLMIVWSVVAALTSVPVRLLGRVLSRPLSRRAAWQLALAAGHPGALVLTAALILYGLGQLPLPGLFLAALFRGGLLGLYLFMAPWHLPRLSHRSGRAANPFNPAAGRKQRPSPPHRNPFARSG